MAGLSWVDDVENYHLIDLMKKTHYAFFILPIGIILPGCWSIGPINTASNFFGILSRSAKQGEDPVMTYKRLTVLDQDIFNDEMFDAWRLFITWEMKRIEKVAGPSANQHNTSLNATEDNGWYRIKKSNCPQDYGYNGIKLQVPKAGAKVEIYFKDSAGSDSFNAFKNW